MMLTRRERTPLRKLMLLGAMAGAGALVEDTATGNPLTFITDVSKPLKSLLIPFTPVQSGSGDPSPQNIRPIVPWNGLKVWNGGKNLFDVSAVIRRDGYILNEQGQETTSNVSGYTQNITPVKPSTKYTFSGIVSYDGYLWRIYFYDKNGSFVSRTDSIDGFTVGNTFTFTTPSNCYGIAFQYTREFAQFSTFMVEVGQTATAYEPYKPITETDISFPSPVYGGEHEAVSGKLMDNRYPVNITPQEVPSIYIDTVTSTLMTIYIQYAPNHIPSVVANSVISNRFSRNISSGNSGRMVQANAGVYLVLPADEMTGTDLTAVREWFENNPTILVFELATPQEITLTPEQITALLGNNTIWSDADGSMTAVFLKKG